MRNCSFTPLAKQDLQDISDYIAVKNLDAANRLINHINSICISIVNMPEMGRSREELLPGLRSIVEGKYIIFYVVIADEIRIYRILHGARHIEKLFS